MPGCLENQLRPYGAGSFENIRPPLSAAALARSENTKALNNENKPGK